MEEEDRLWQQSYQSNEPNEMQSTTAVNTTSKAENVCDERSCRENHIN